MLSRLCNICPESRLVLLLICDKASRKGSSSFARGRAEYVIFSFNWKQGRFFFDFSDSMINLDVISIIVFVKFINWLLST